MGPEIMLALQAMRAAYSGIQYCCEALREGTVEIQRIKKTVEGGVSDAKKIYTEVTGLWGWLKNLFAPAKPAAPAASSPSAQPEASKPAGKKAKEQYTTHVPSEHEVVQQFITHLGDWFDKYDTLKTYADKRYTEVFGKDVIDQKEVLELTQLQTELDAAYPTLRTLMTEAPWQLGPIWSKFNEMQDKVKAGQAARQLRQKREQAKRDADAAQARSDRIDRNMTWFWSLVLVGYFWIFMSVVWLNVTTTQ